MYTERGESRIVRLDEKRKWRVYIRWKESARNTSLLQLLHGLRPSKRSCCCSCIMRTCVYVQGRMGSKRVSAQNVHLYGHCLGAQQSYTFFRALSLP